MSDDLRKWRVYNPLDPLWDFPPARSALEAKNQAQIIVLRYRDHHGLGSSLGHQGDIIWNELSKLAEAIRNIPCSSPTSEQQSSPIPANASSKSTSNKPMPKS